MTLIAAFRCDASGHLGVVVCADSQETVGDYRVTVDKIRPRDAGQHDLIIGGAGNTAALIDGQADAIERAVSRWPANLDDDEIRTRLERALLAYHVRQVRYYPASDEEKRLRFVICLRDKQSSHISLWKTDGTAIEAVSDYVLLGWEEAVYDYEVRWLYHRGLWAAQAMLLGIHLFTVAKNSLYVGGPTQVIVVRDNGMHVQDPNDIQELERRVETFNKALAQLVLACPDISIHSDEFRALLGTFEGRVMQLRDHYLGRVMATSLHRALTDRNARGNAVPQLPLGTVIERRRNEGADADVLHVELIRIESAEDYDSPDSQESEETK